MEHHQRTAAPGESGDSVCFFCLDGQSGWINGFGPLVCRDIDDFQEEVSMALDPKTGVSCSVQRKALNGLGKVENIQETFAQNRFDDMPIY